MVGAHLVDSQDVEQWASPEDVVDRTTGKPNLTSSLRWINTLTAKISITLTLQVKILSKMVDFHTLKI